MDLEQLAKQVNWLEEERRRDKLTIHTLEEKLSTLEGNIPGLINQIKEISGDLIRFSSNLSRFDQIETELAQMRVEYSRSIDAVEKNHAEHNREMERVRYADLEMLNKSIAEVRKGLDPIPELKRSIQLRTEEDFRLSRLIEEVGSRVVEYRRSDDDFKRSQKLLEESQRQDTKRLTDVQGEVAAIRKRQDEQRGRVDLVSDNVRKLEMRTSELLASEAERRQAQVAFIDRQNMSQMERDRLWKEWQARFEIIEKSAVGIDAQMQALDATHRAVKKAQEGFEDITQRFERRINEITEMQRLSEDRFRQEWVAFKADDQKRWTNYSLVQEESQREITRQFEKYTERLVLLEDMSQEVQDMLQLVREENRKRLQSMLVLAREWMENYDRTFGRSG